MTTRLVCLALLLTASPAYTQEWREGRAFFSAGAEYRTGDFGRSDGDTDITAVPLSLEYRFTHLRFTPYDRFRVRLSLPLLSVDGPERDAFGVSSDDRDTGFGDLGVRASYLWVPEKRRKLPFFELSGRIKIPTGSEGKDLSTGEFDFGADLRVLKSYRLERRGRRITPFVSVGYKVVGEPSGSDRDNVWRSSFGASLRLSERRSVGLRYSWRESSTGRSDRSVISPSATFRMSDHVRVSPYLRFGVSSEAEDWGAGFRVRYQLTER